MIALDPGVIPDAAQRPLQRTEYDHLVRLGFLDDDRIELLYGRMVKLPRQTPAHAFTVRRLTELLTIPLVGRAEIACHGPLAASDVSEPEPDVSILPPGDYLDDHAASALLVVEVADESRHRDLTLKARLYSEMNVPDYWVVDLTGREVVVHRKPSGDRYAEVTTVDAAGEVALLAFPDVVVRVAAVLPPA